MILDISYAQPVDSLDWLKLKDLEICVIIRGGQSTYEDNLFRVHYDNALMAGVPAGMYWFYQPDLRPEYQAQACIDLWNSLEVKPKVIALDVENIHYGDVNILPPSVAAHTAWLKYWLETVEAATGIIPMIYTRADYWNVWVTAAPNWKHYPLWIASWEVYSQDIRMPVDWQEWKIWQFGSGDQEGSLYRVDLNNYNGTDQEAIEFFGGKEEPMTTQLYKVDKTQSSRAVVLTVPSTSKYAAPKDLSVDAVILPMGGMDRWDGSHMLLYTEPTFKGRFTDFTANGLPVIGRFELDAGYWLKEQHIASEVLSQTATGSEAEKMIAIRANLVLPKLLEAWAVSGWTWDTIISKSVKWNDVKALELSMVGTEGFNGAQVTDYWQTITFNHVATCIRYLQLKGMLPAIPVILRTGPWWLALYKNDFVVMLGNAKDWLWLDLGQWTLTSTATFDKVSDIYAYRPADTFKFSAYPDNYFERIVLHNYTGDTQKCRQLTDASGVPQTVELSLWQSDAADMATFLGIVTPPPPPPPPVDTDLAKVLAAITELSDKLDNLQLAFDQMENRVIDQEGMTYNMMVVQMEAWNKIFK